MVLLLVTGGHSPPLTLTTNESRSDRHVRPRKVQKSEKWPLASSGTPFFGRPGRIALRMAGEDDLDGRVGFNEGFQPGEESLDLLIGFPSDDESVEGLGDMCPAGRWFEGVGVGKGVGGEVAVDDGELEPTMGLPHGDLLVEPVLRFHSALPLGTETLTLVAEQGRGLNKRV